MENTIDPGLDAKNAELFQLLIPHRTSDVLQRINLWVIAKTGRKLPDYIANGASLEEKSKVIAELTEIVRAQDWSKLPTVPNGQASSSAIATKSAPAPRVAPAVPLNPAVPLVLAQTPVLVSPAGAVPIPAPLKPAAQPGSHPVVTLPVAATIAQGDIGQQIAALITQLVPQAVPAAPPSLGDKEVRKIVRAELAAAFTTLATALIK